MKLGLYLPGYLFIPLVFTFLWYCCYRFHSAKARIRKAKQQGKTPNLKQVRLFYIITGIIALAWYWFLFYLLTQFKV